EALAGEVRRAERMLAEQCQSFPHPEPCSKLRVQLAARIDALKPLEDAGNSHLGLACITAIQCARAANWIGDLMAQKHAWSGAKYFYRRAVHEVPNAENWIKFARAAWKSGQPKAGLEALRQAEQAA